MSDLRKRQVERESGKSFEQQDQEDVQTEPAIREGRGAQRLAHTAACLYSLHPVGQSKEGQLSGFQGIPPSPAVNNGGGFFNHPNIIRIDNPQNAAILPVQPACERFCIDQATTAAYAPRLLPVEFGTDVPAIENG
jgi:hypothetical protein